MRIASAELSPTRVRARGARSRPEMRVGPPASGPRGRGGPPAISCQRGGASARGRTPVPRRTAPRVPGGCVGARGGEQPRAVGQVVEHGELEVEGSARIGPVRERGRRLGAGQIALEIHHGAYRRRGQDAGLQAEIDRNRLGRGGRARCERAGDQGDGEAGEQRRHAEGERADGAAHAIALRQDGLAGLARPAPIASFRTIAAYMERTPSCASLNSRR